MDMKLLYLLVGLLGILAGSGQVDALARLIKVPLKRATTQGAGSHGQPVINYYTFASVGTPSKLFAVQFDVGTNELILPHYSWNPFNRNMHYKNGFQCKVSSSCVKNNQEHNIEYQHVKLQGKRYEDYVSLDLAHRFGSGTVVTNGTMPLPVNATNGISRPYTSWRQSFLAISSASDGRFSPLVIDGFFGLGPSAISATGIGNILTNLHSANLIDNLQFSFWFNPVLDHPNGGTLILGGVDTSLYQGKIYWHPMAQAQQSSWALGLQAVFLGGQSVGCSRPGCQAKFSTGLSDIYGPRADVERIYSLLNTTRSSAGLQLVDCRRIPTLPHITFSIDGIPYNLFSSNYIRKIVTGSVFKKETCYVAILPSDDDATTWTLSTPFLGAYYSIFDITYRQIGFAALK